MKDNNDFLFKYGSLVAKLGFVQIPNILVRNRKALNLTGSEQELAMILISYEFSGVVSFPSLKQITNQNGMSSSTIHSAKKGLENKRYLSIDRSKPNKYKTHQYDLLGLRKKLRAVAKNVLDYQFIKEKISEEEYWKLIEKDNQQEALFTNIFKN